MRNKNQSSAAPSMTSGLRSNEPSTAGGRELRLKARPPARFNSLRSERTVNQNKSHWVTPFWHNDTRSRVTVTFGAPRPEMPERFMGNNRFANRGGWAAQLRKHSGSVAARHSP